MLGNPFAKPDITLTLDVHGVILDIVPSDALAEEELDGWRGRPWGDTIDPAVTLEVKRMIEEMRQKGASSCFQVNQLLPSGRQLPFEYSTISLGRSAGFVAIGKNLQAISDLQERLHLAQQERERDYWKFREIETRYKMLFDASTEAAVVVRVTNLRIVEANVAAIRSLGLLPGPEFHPDMPARDRKSFESMLEQVREKGRAPGIALHLAPGESVWSLRASLMTTEAGSFYLFQMTPMGAPPIEASADEAALIANIMQRLPDGFAIVDRNAIIRKVNHTFLDLAQVGAERAVIGQSIKRWLSKPGADIAVIMGLAQRHGSVRSMTTTIYGDLGSSTQVEISAIADRAGQPQHIGLLLRDVTMRSIAGHASTAVSHGGEALDTRLGELSLEDLVRASTEALEQKMILSALEQCSGNRTAAAKLLRLSRQSLHTKLNKYDLADQ